MERGSGRVVALWCLFRCVRGVSRVFASGRPVLGVPPANPTQASGPACQPTPT